MTATNSREPNSRESLPDRLRGIALLGIVVVNAAFLGISTTGYTQSSVDGAANLVTAFLVVALAEGKFYLLFSFLFGYSASFILRDNSAPNRRRYLRRLFALFIFGLAHAIFFFIGDILITYSILGVLLFAVSRTSDRVLRRWTIGAIALSVILLLALASLAAAFPEDFSATGGLESALESGTFWSAASARLAELPGTVPFVLLLQGPMAFAAFTLGLRASRHKLLADPGAHIILWRRLALWGWLIGLPLQVLAASLQVSATANGTPFSVAGATGLALGFATAPILTAGYIGSIALIMARRPHFLSVMAPAGRMSLTVYISESALLSLVFAAYGLGYFGQWGALPVTLVSIASWAILSVFAWLWMKKFSQGPLESVLARMTGKQYRA
ncbi:MAG: DUF418 domain-containing protein [Candidatus Nanopelagicales bacterium]|nr:DUF418 domain-containing protein [Candidatus Nanopelagicales bacterium]